VKLPAVKTAQSFGKLSKTQKSKESESGAKIELGSKEQVGEHLKIVFFLWVGSPPLVAQNFRSRLILTFHL
jgi:hypothetical protein